MPTPTGMAGPRSWLFQCGTQSVGMTNTDFRVLYSADAGQATPLMKMTLKAVWEHSDFTQFNMDRVKYMEDRLSVLATSELVNCVGTLTVDGVPVVMPMKFKGISLDDSGIPNELLIYTVEFERAFPGAQMNRSLLFGDSELIGDFQNLFVTFAADDRTTFAEVFRSAPLLMLNGPGLQHLTVTGLIQRVGGDTALERQLNVEWAAGDLIWLQKGKSRTLTLDGREVGLCYLKDVVIKDSLPNAILFELQFSTGYGVA